MAKKVFVIDIARCNGCHNCQIVCKDEHVGNDWTPIAKPQPEIGQFWLRAHREGARHGAQGEGGLPAAPLHALRRRPLHRGLPGRGRALQARRRPGHHRPGEVHRLPALRGRLPVRRHLLQRGSQPRPEVHRLRPPPRRRLGRAPLRRRLPHRAIKLMDEDEAKELIAKGEVWKPELEGRGQAPGLLPQPAQEVHRRHAVRAGGRRGGHRRHGDPQGRRRQGAHHRDRRLRRLLVRRHRRRRVRRWSSSTAARSSRSPAWTPPKSTSTSETSR